MAWKEMSVDELAKSLDVSVGEIREKQRLIRLVLEARKARKLSQAALAKKLGVTQGRIAQIESGIGTSNITFDVLFNILTVLGYDLKIIARKAA
jgi:transcriptional regulator with XRE-family HTH domain